METQNRERTAKLDANIMDNTPARIRDLYRELPAYAAANALGPLDEDVVVLDTETTGLSYNHDELIQIAAARMSHGEITGWYVTFVDPGTDIPEEIQHLTHIGPAEIDGAPDPDEALEGLVEFVGDSPVVAHNAPFDYTFCTKRASGYPLKENIWLDSLELARIVLPRMRSHRLLDLIRAFDGPESTHRADDDVAATCVLFRILLAGVAKMPADLLKYIADLAPVEEWGTGYAFKTLADETAPVYSFMANRRLAVKRSTGSMRRDAQDALNTSEAAIVEDVDPEMLTAAAVPLEFPSAEEIAADFAADGLLGRLYENYEPREEQAEMAQAVNRALTAGTNLVVEAGTGVGKSMAYLVPLVKMAKRNGITVGVATKTNALLDQLVHKELPLLAGELDITVAPLKGFTHYLCNRKVNQFVQSGPSIIEVRGQSINQAPSLAALVSFVEQTDFDDIDGLKTDYRAYPRWAITTKSQECLRRRCPFFGRSCYVHGAREQAGRSDVVVTNHSLLFLDSRMENSLLPQRIRYWVVDEAHGAEDEARRAASTEVSSEAIRSLARRVSSTSPRTNVLMRAARNESVTQEGKALYDSMIGKAMTAGGAFDIAAEEYCLTVKDLLYYDKDSRNKGYEYFELWLNDEIRGGSAFSKLKSCAKSIQDTLDELIKHVRNITLYLEEIEDNSRELREVALLALELRDLYESIDLIFIKQPDNRVYSARLERKKDRFNDRFTMQPLEVGEDLNATFYHDTNAVIYTSATLTVAHKFDRFIDAMGLNATEESRCDTLQVASSFDFDKNMRVYIPTDIPEPGRPGYLEALQELLIGLHEAREGSLLTLFTNRREMERCHGVVQDALRGQDLRVVCQRWGVSVKGLRDDFLADEHLSLFALRSFWEGFDAPGSTLKGVIVSKLPFGLPTDPLSCERGQRDDHAWAHYSLPSAVIDVKQAVGRLIRTAEDKGFVVLADQRLISKYYGRTFINSLPSRNVAMMPSADIIEEVLQTRLAEAAAREGEF